MLARLRLRTRLALAFALVALAPLAVLVPWSSAHLRSALQAELDARTEHAVATAQAAIDQRGQDVRRAVDALDCCYASDLTPLLTGENAPALWFHGHIHSNRDYEVAGCRVIANPRGYPGHRPSDGRENPAFNPELVIEIGRPLMPMPGM